MKTKVITPKYSFHKNKEYYKSIDDLLFFYNKLRLSERKQYHENGELIIYKDNTEFISYNLKTEKWTNLITQ